MTVSTLTARTVPHHEKRSTRGGTPVSYMIVHHWAGTSGGDARLVNPSADVSANYILYSSGELVGQVPEEYRAWTSGSPAADNPAITIETQNSAAGGDWPVSDEALEKLAQLAADLCERYGWGTLDRSRVRGHREFAQTACPGPYLFARLDWIVERGNEIIGGGEPPRPDKKRDEDMPRILNVRTVLTPTSAPEGKIYFDGGPGVGIKHISNPYHLNLLERFLADAPGSVFLPGELTIINTYLAPNTPTLAPETVEAAVAKAIKNAGGSVDAAAVASAVEAVLKDDFAAIPANVAAEQAERLRGE